MGTEIVLHGEDNVVGLSSLFCCALEISSGCQPGDAHLLTFCPPGPDDLAKVIDAGCFGIDSSLNAARHDLAFAYSDSSKLATWLARREIAGNTRTEAGRT
jgi:hypothetical protein